MGVTNVVSEIKCEESYGTRYPDFEKLLQETLHGLLAFDMNIEDDRVKGGRLSYNNLHSGVGLFALIIPNVAILLIKLTLKVPIS